MSGSKTIKYERSKNIIQVVLVILFFLFTILISIALDNRYNPEDNIRRHLSYKGIDASDITFTKNGALSFLAALNKQCTHPLSR